MSKYETFQSIYNFISILSQLLFNFFLYTNIFFDCYKMEVHAISLNTWVWNGSFKIFVDKSEKKTCLPLPKISVWLFSSILVPIWLINMLLITQPLYSPSLANGWQPPQVTPILMKKSLSKFTKTKVIVYSNMWATTKLNLVNYVTLVLGSMSKMCSSPITKHFISQTPLDIVKQFKWMSPEIID